MKKVVAILLALVLALSFVACAAPTPAPAQPAAEDKPAADKPAAEEKPAAPAGNYPAIFDKELKIAVIRNDGSSDHCSQMFEGAVKFGNSLGMKVDTMITNSDDVKYQDLVQQCIESGYDGMFLTHGKQEYAYDMVKSVVDAGIPVVTFDTLPYNAAGEIPAGVTVTAQDDYSLARDSLDALIKYCKETKNIDVPKIMTTFFGPGIPPLDRRNEILNEYIKAGKVVLVETVTATDASNFLGDFQAKFGAILNKYPKGTFDALWSTADVFCQGAYIATEDAGRLGEFPMFTIDASNTDMDYMRKEGSSWITCSAVDAALIGEVCVRILACKMAGEETPDVYNLPCQTFYQADLKPDTNVVNLGAVVEGWGKSDDFIKDWMKAVQEAKAK